MKLSQFKQHLGTVSAVNLVRPDGAYVPSHFHITEAGLATKHFIDCGGTVHTDKAVNLQVWVSTDYEHRLAPDKLLKILSISEKLFGDEDLDVEVEYQSDTIGRYGLDFNGKNFVLTSKATDCLAKDACDVPSTKLQLSTTTCCTPNGGCC